jgi:hypothetical protein
MYSLVDVFSFLLLFSIVLPGIIRGLFWSDSPAPEGMLWGLVLIVLLYAISLLDEHVLKSDLWGIVAIAGIIAGNVYALKGATFTQSWRHKKNSGGDTNE